MAEVQPGFSQAAAGPAAGEGYLLRFSRGLNRAVEFSLFAGGMSMAAVVAAQVFYRYVLNDSLFWSEELARYIMIWITFLGAACAFFRQSHPGIDVIYVRLPAGGRRGLRIMARLVCMLFFLVMIVSGSQFAWFVRNQVSPALGAPKWLVYAVVPLSGCLMLVYAAVFLVQDLFGGKRGLEAEE